MSTSHRHRNPPLIATPSNAGFHLKGYAPWVTGAVYTDFLVLGAHKENQGHSLFVVPSSTVDIRTPPQLSALNGSYTTSISIDTIVFKDALIFEEDRESKSTIAKTASRTSSALALGLAKRALEELKVESTKRNEIQNLSIALEERFYTLQSLLFSDSDSFELRYNINCFALDCTQALLISTKGSGYMENHIASRLYKQAHFFLVWSCPDQIAQKHLDRYTRPYEQ